MEQTAVSVGLAVQSQAHAEHMEFTRPEVGLSLAVRYKAARLVARAAHARREAHVLMVRSARAQHHRYSAPALYPEDITSTVRVSVRRPRGMVAGDPGE